jgi:hypothetical protein
MFGVYLKVMKGYVWHSTTWAVDTYGITGRLLEQGLERYVEIVQLVSLAITYALSSRSLRQGARPEPWMALALLVFSMTSLNDTTNAFKCYRRDVIDGTAPHLSKHFNLTVELPLKAIARGYTYSVIPISWQNRRHGLSKLKLQEMGEPLPLHRALRVAGKAAHQR